MSAEKLWKYRESINRADENDFFPSIPTPIIRWPLNALKNNLWAINEITRIDATRTHAFILYDNLQLSWSQCSSHTAIPLCSNARMYNLHVCEMQHCWKCVVKSILRLHRRTKGTFLHLKLNYIKKLTKGIRRFCREQKQFFFITSPLSPLVFKGNLGSCRSLTFFSPKKVNKDAHFRSPSRIMNLKKNRRYRAENSVLQKLSSYCLKILNNSEYSASKFILSIGWLPLTLGIIYAIYVWFYFVHSFEFVKAGAYNILIQRGWLRILDGLKLSLSQKFWPSYEYEVTSKICPKKTVLWWRQ